MCGVSKNTLRSILNKLQISHTTLLTAVTMLHIRPPGRTHNWKLVPFDSMESWSSAVTKACVPSSRHSLSQVFRHFSFLTVFKRTSRMLFFSIFFNAASKSTGHCYPLWTQPSLVPRPCHAPRVASRPRQQPPPPQWRGTSPEPWGARGLDLSWPQSASKRSPQFKMAPQSLICCLKAQGSNEEPQSCWPSLGASN